MRTATRLALFLVLPATAAVAADPAVRWEEKPFFARKAGTKVPPPAYYATTGEVPAGAEVKIRVVRSPENATVAVHPFLGGPTFARGAVKEFSGLKADQDLAATLPEKMKVGVTTRIGDRAGECKGVEQKDGAAVLKYAAGDQELVLEVRVVTKAPAGR